MKTASNTWPNPSIESNGLAAARTPSRAEMFDLLAPEIVLPEQFHGESEALASRSGTKGLMLAILEDAIWSLADVSSPMAQRRMEARQAEMWIRERDGSWLFSFENICAVLEVDSSRLRERLLTQSGEGGADRLPRRRLSHRVERGERRKRSAAGRAAKAKIELVIEASPETAAVEVHYVEESVVSFAP